MLVVGTGGLAAQMFRDFEKMRRSDLAFWTEIETPYSFIGHKYSVFKTDDGVKEYFSSRSRHFTLAVGSAKNRRYLKERFTQLGGIFTSFVSPGADVDELTKIGTGCTILSIVNVEPLVEIGAGSLLNKTSNVGHGCRLGEYCELAPGVILTGEVQVGDNCFFGTGALILPKVRIGNNVIVAAGAVVKRDIPDNCYAVGVPAKNIKAR